MTVSRIAVGGSSDRYEVVIGNGVSAELPHLVGSSAERVAVLYTGNTWLIARPLVEALEAAGHTVHSMLVPDGEAAKDATVAAQLWGKLGRAGFTRSDAVVGIGGGAVTDLAGFVAATWLRGVRCVLVPTTMLGMVDAAVGGKTGINTDEGKNLVGAFHPPAGVLCDLDALSTLPADDHIAGLAEVVKAGFIADTAIVDLVESDPREASRPEGRHTRELVERAVAVKAEVVSADLRESGRREMLNYGHTLGHAIERVEGYTFRHGYAVSVGMLFAAELSRLDGRIGAEVVHRHRDVLSSVGLPVSYPEAAWPRLNEAMRVDKKARGATLRFVVLDAPGRPALLASPSEDLLTAAYRAVSV
ncbi:3-dehydroquinate synthase [Haloactinospora alba]|uniref:3-dehydroquinate synthase n=1 Tax=Haloactinospora alba TaxID=405555 RepID=A0A543NJK6_9ACTN|nr:3-dehydroquinate synthase [Haloactinospora alba]TQN31999.1 3-dehydroquinate synthase [Haloactinospora alba]